MNETVAPVPEMVTVGPDVCVQVNLSWAAGICALVLLALRTTTEPGRVVMSAPALAVGGMFVGPAGGAVGHVAGVAVGATLPGHGVNWPKCWSSSKNPFARCWRPEKSISGVNMPPMVFSGKIHSVTGWTY